MTLSDLCKEVLELDAKATKGPWVHIPRSEDVHWIVNEERECRVAETFRSSHGRLIAHARNNYAKLALAAQLYDALAAELEQWAGDKKSIVPSLALKHYGETAATMRADVQKIVSGK